MPYCLKFHSDFTGKVRASRMKTQIVSAVKRLKQDLEKVSSPEQLTYFGQTRSGNYGFYINAIELFCIVDRDNSVCEIFSFSI